MSTSSGVRPVRAPTLGALLAVAQIAVLGQGCRTSPPNASVAAAAPIVLISVDTLRADHVTAALMPQLTALRAESLDFTETITTAPLTAPAHASLLTALYPPRHGVRDNGIHRLPPSVPTYAEHLKRRGYATGAFVSAPVLDARVGLNRGFDLYDDAIEGDERDAVATLARARTWVAAQLAARPAEPFFAWIHLFEPHAPYRTGSYAGEVSSVDEALGGFIEFLRATTLLERTIVSITADHGEALGDHGEDTHGFFLYDSVLRIPWIVRAPGRSSARYDTQTRIVDIMPTLVGLANVAHAGTSSAEREDGVDLSRFVGGAMPADLEAYSETWLPRDQFGWSELTALRTPAWKYIRAPRDELYDLERDPAESRNLGGADENRIVAAGRAIRAIEAFGLPRSADGPSDAQLAERFMSLGYLGRSPRADRDSSVLADPKDKLPVYRSVMRALELSARGRKAEALAILDAGRKLDEGVAQLHFLRGTVLGDLGRHADAVAALERAVALSPEHATARFKLALAYLRVNAPRQAEATLEKVLADDPSNARAWHNLAAIAYTRGDVARVETLERKALALDGGYVEAWNTLGAVYLVTGRHAQALDALTSAARHGPTNGQVQANLALVYRALDREADAAAAQEKACALDRRYCRPPSPR
ncbi:MAG: sulfatase-like hydrolase/transferase [Vicinamibacterales bacterium]